MKITEVDFSKITMPSLTLSDASSDVMIFPFLVLFSNFTRIGCSLVGKTWSNQLANKKKRKFQNNI